MPRIPDMRVIRHADEGAPGDRPPDHPRLDRSAESTGLGDPGCTGQVITCHSCHLTLTKPGGRRGDPTMPLTAPYADAASIESVE